MVLIIIITMPCYKSGELMMTLAHYKSGGNDDKSDNNKDKIYLLLKRWGLIGHVLDHVLDYVLNDRSDYIIIDFMTMALQLLFFGVSSDKQVIVKSYLQRGRKPLNSIKEQEEN